MTMICTCGRRIGELECSIRTDVTLTAPCLCPDGGSAGPADIAAPRHSTASLTSSASVPPSRGRGRAATEQVGIYVNEVTMRDARAAYMADFRLRGEDAPSGLDHWIGEAVRELAALGLAGARQAP